MDWICDFHSHLLPAMDDGCKTVQESLDALKSAYEQGVRVQFLTPHYYPVEDVDTFLQRRQASAEALSAAMQQEKEPMPQIHFGAEVAYHPGLVNLENLEALCLGNSRYLLLEMPFSGWGNEVVRDICNICNVRGVVPILAHIERYLGFQNKKQLEAMLKQDVLVQMNAEHLLDWKTRGNALSLLKKGKVQLLGSDCHNLTNRPHNLGAAVQLLQKKHAHLVSDIAQLSAYICEQVAG